MVWGGTTPVWCGVTFVPNLLLLFYTEHVRTQHSTQKPFVCDVKGCGYAAKLLHHLTGECCDGDICGS